MAVFEHLSKLSSIHNNHLEYYRSGVSSILILEEKVETLFQVFLFMPANPFFDFFNQIMSELAAGGLLSYWRKFEINPKGLKRKVDKIGPQVLTMDHLEIGFLVCLLPCGIGAIIFVFELVLKCCKTTDSKASKLSIDKNVDLRIRQNENVGVFECQTIENDESTTETNEHSAESRSSSSRSVAAKLDTLSQHSSIFDVESFKSTNPNRKETRSSGPSKEESLSLFSFK